MAEADGSLASLPLADFPVYGVPRRQGTKKVGAKGHPCEDLTALLVPYFVALSVLPEALSAPRQQARGPTLGYQIGEPLLANEIIENGRK